MAECENCKTLKTDFKNAGNEIEQLRTQIGEQHGRMSTMANEILDLREKLKIADMRFEKMGLSVVDAWIASFDGREDAILFLKHTMQNELSINP